MKKQALIYSLIIATAVVTRLIPHAWNFAPVTAVAIVAAMYLPLKQAVALPLAIRFVSDAILGFFAWPLMLAVYASHLFGAVMGLWLRKSVTSPAFQALSPKWEREGARLGAWPKVFIAPVVSALVFFLVTNFAFLYPNYPHNLSGIIAAYTNGLPFLRGTLLGDVIYTVTFVGVFESVAAWQRAKAVAIKLTQ